MTLINKTFAVMLSIGSKWIQGYTCDALFPLQHNWDFYSSQHYVLKVLCVDINVLKDMIQMTKVRKLLHKKT